jgi:hypothetical protein
MLIMINIIIYKLRLFLTFCFILPFILTVGQNRFWVGGSGSWSQSTHWSNISGGPGGATIPSLSDQVVIDVASGASGFVITLDGSPTCASFNSTGANNFTLSGSASISVQINGSLNIGTTTSHTFAGTYNFSSPFLGNQITLNNSSNTIAAKFSFTGAGEYKFQTNIILNNKIEHSNGTINTNGKIVNVQDYEAIGSLPKNFNFENSNIKITRYFIGSPGLLTLSTGSKIELSNPLAEIRNCNNLTFNSILFSATSTNITNNGQLNTSSGCTISKLEFNHHGVIYGNHTIDTIKISQGKILSVGNGNILSVKDLLLSGSCTAYTTLKSTLQGTQATIQKSSGLVDLVQMKIQDINATGGATFNAYNSFNLGNNLGWNIQNGRLLYWVGGSGNWHDEAHWSTSSGGTGGACYPNQFDNVIIDANSFTPTSKSIQVTSASTSIKIKDFDCSSNNDMGASITNSTSEFSEIHGNLILNNNFSIFGNLNLKGLNKTIQSNGFTFNNSIFLIDNASYSLLDSISSISIIEIVNGSLQSNSKKIKVFSFNVKNNSILNLGNSILELTGNLSQNELATINNTNTKIIGKGTFSVSVQLYNTTIDTILFQNINNGNFSGNNNQIKLLSFGPSLYQSNIQIGTNNSFKKIVSNGNGNFTTNLTVDTLVLSPGKTYLIYNTTVVDSMQAHSTCSNGQINITGGGSTIASISSSKSLSCNTCVFTNFKFNSTGGTGSFTAVNSTNIIGNSGINFLPVNPRTVYWVGGSGIWNDQSHWSLSSGGPSSACLPTKFDNVVFDNNSLSSGSATITLNSTSQTCKNITFLNGIGKNITISPSNSGYFLGVKGNFFGSPFTTITGNEILKFTKTGGNISFKQGGAIITGGIIIDSSCVFNVIDSLIAGYLNVNAGTFNSNKKNIRITSSIYGEMTFKNSGTSINLDSSYIASASSIIVQNAVNMSSVKTIFHLTDPSSGTFSIGNYRNIYKVIYESSYAILITSRSLIEYMETGKSEISTNPAQITTGETTTEPIVPIPTPNLDSRIKRAILRGDANIFGYGSWFDTLEFKAGKKYQFAISNAEPDTISFWISNSSCALGNTIIQSVVSGSQAKIFLTQMNSLTYASIKDINIVNPGMLLAGNSINISNNTNITFNSNSRSLYWVGGTGIWNDPTHWSSTSGGTGGECVPTLIDDVFFDSASFPIVGQTLTLTTALSYCRNMNWTWVTNNPSWITSLNTNSMEIYGSVILSPSIGIINFLGGYINIRGTSPNQITSNGKNLGSNVRLDFRNTSPYVLLDTLRIDGIITIYSGASVVLVPGAMKINSIIVNSGGTLNYSNSVIYCKNSANFSTGSTISDVNGKLIFRDGFSYVLNSSTRNFNNVIIINTNANYYLNPNARLSISCTNCAFNLLNLKYPTIFSSNFTVDSLLLDAGYRYSFSSNRTLTINEYFSGNGNCQFPGGYIDFSGPSTGPKAKINSNIPISIDKAIFRGIDIDGGFSFIASNSINLGNNLDITFTTILSRNLFWVGGEGNWFDASHWSITSGGLGGECPPNQEDNVFFNNASFPINNKIISAYSIPICKNMDWSGAGSKNPTLRFYESLEVYGNLTTTSGITLQGLSFSITSLPIILSGANTNNVISSNGYNFSWVEINGTGIWTLSDQIQLATFYLKQGTLNTNNQQINITSLFQADNSTSGTNSSLNMTNSIFNILNGSSFQIQNPSNITIIPGNSTIRFNSGGTFRSGLNHIYNIVEFNHPTNSANIIGSGGAQVNNLTLRGPAIFSGSINMNTLEVAGGKTYNFSSNQTYVINNLNGSGTCTTILNLVGAGIGASTTKFFKASGSLNLQNAAISNIHGTGGAIFNAFNSTGTNAVGWNIIPKTNSTLYWVNDEGSWSDLGHWSFLSGGPGGACLPESTNDIVFDENSFSGFNKTVDLNIDGLCKNMTWNSNKKPILTGNSTKYLKIYGSVELDSNMIITYSGPITLESTLTSTFKSKGGIINAPVSITGHGSTWYILDSLHINNNITLVKGSLFTNGKKIFAYKFISTGTNTRSLELGSSNIELAGPGVSWDIDETGFSFQANTSTLNFTNSNVLFEPVSNLLYNNIILNKNNVPGNSIFTNSTNNIFNSVTLNQSSVIEGNHTFQKLIVEGGKILTLKNGTTQTILNELKLLSNINDTITINSSTPGSQAFWDIPVLSNCFAYIKVSDNVVINGMAPNVIRSRNLGNNTNWNFKNNQNWEGNMDTNWHNPINWECGRIPEPTSEIIIQAGTPFYPKVSNNAEIQKLILQPSSTLIIEAPAELKVNGM